MDPKSEGSHMYVFPTIPLILYTVNCSSDFNLYRLHYILTGTILLLVLLTNALITILEAVCGSLGYIYRCNVDLGDILICGMNLNTG